MMDERQRDAVMQRVLEAVVRIEERLNGHLRFHSHHPHWLAAGAAVVSCLAAVAALALMK